MKREQKNKGNQYGYSAWSMEEVWRFARFFCLPLIVVILIVVILAMDKKKNPDFREGEAVEESTDLAMEESSEGSEQESLPVQMEQKFTPNSVPAVTDLFNRYFSAKERADASAIYQLFGWTGELGLEDLQRQLQYDARYTEGYRNIVCYTAPGEIEGTYLVCVSYDLKFKNSLTLAPGFQWSYVRTGTDGNLYLTVEDELSEPEKAFVEETLKADEIVLLRVEIYAKLRAALESDPALAESYGILEKKGGSAGAGQTEQHEANVQIDGVSAPGSESGESLEGNGENPEGGQDTGSSGTGTVGDGMIHIEGNAGLEGKAAEGGTGDSNVSLPGSTGSQGGAPVNSEAAGAVPAGGEAAGAASANGGAGQGASASGETGQGALAGGEVSGSEAGAGVPAGNGTAGE